MLLSNELHYSSGRKSLVNKIPENLKKVIVEKISSDPKWFGKPLGRARKGEYSLLPTHCISKGPLYRGAKYCIVTILVAHFDNFVAHFGKGLKGKNIKGNTSSKLVIFCG